jgi:hypothetical protein
VTREEDTRDTLQILDLAHVIFPETAEHFVRRASARHGWNDESFSHVATGL